MQRTWTAEARDDWINRRAARREQANRPDSDPRVLREESLERERTEIHETLEDLTRKSAWELQKRPTRTYPAPFAGKMFLPLRYQDDDRKQSIKFAEGDDLNFLVYRFYDAKPDSGFQGTNYVTEDGITSKRHEYLGPTPHVAGYQLDDASKTARIEWWDPYTSLRWVGGSVWKIELYFDEVVGGWVSRPRGDFDEATDTQLYLASGKGP